MGTHSFQYPAYITRQTPEGAPLVFFSSPATQIERWSGIPQRRRLDERESIGFQRGEDRSRIRELTAFYKDHRNIVQNPLLAAVQDEASVRFESSPESPEFGIVYIDAEDYSEFSLADLMREVAHRFESRVPELKSVLPDIERIAELNSRVAELDGLVSEDSESNDNGDAAELLDDEESAPDDEPGEVAGVVLSEETQLVDFYKELQARIDVLDRLGPAYDTEDFLGFTREVMISYLNPIVLVDGQHRLRGAVQAALDSLDRPEGRQRIMDLTDALGDADMATDRLLEESSRKLPVSLLMNSSPSEHVFQFVVVNQKATPLNKALLGTIVATSLSRDELEPVADRLRHAGIKLDDSRAVAYLTRSEKSPFCGLVQRGISGDKSVHLQWPVFKGLVTIFRELRGGRLYGEKTDWARVWREHHLLSSDLVAGADEGREYELWSRPDGPWRDVFISFYWNVRNYFGNATDMGEYNAWGSTDSSNLFNKVSLTILAADYFSYLRSQRTTINSTQDVDTTFNAWLEGVSSNYFNKNWHLDGVKKDAIATRKQWAKVWREYRMNPESLPKWTEYRPK
ncbi:hypothetical protein ACIHAX_12955 [Nocardia sp. NPDC051929]|uniref:hypothetical protein n=1 Tax=Nocardia sp. NPDC051929 TaxID=3364327 RepID=UPI0037C55758